MKLNLTRKEKVRYGIAAFLLLLIITNPSITSFKAYVGSNTYQGLRRPINLFICSVYRDYRGNEYVGVMGNFIREPKAEVVYVDDDGDKKDGTLDGSNTVKTKKITGKTKDGLPIFATP